jgi:hypothetical protein
MGSFSEVVMSFTLRSDVDRDVLRAFSGLGVGLPTDKADAVGAAPAPELPPPHDEVVDDYALYEAWEQGAFPDGFTPWAYDWRPFLGGGHWNVYIPAMKASALSWTGKGWHVTFRTTIKSYPEELVYWFGWMGQFAIEGRHDAPELIGYIKHEYERRPWLVWHPGTGPFTFEDLNGPEDG